MTRRRLAAAAAATSAALALLLAGCAADPAPQTPATGSDSIGAERCAANQAAGPITFLTSYAYVASVGIIDVLAADELGYFDALCLDVTLEAGSANAQLVSAGTAQLAGLGGASDVMVARDQGALITGVATYGDTGAIELLTNADSDIRELSDFVGKTVGYKGAIAPQFQAMFSRNGIDPASINWVSVGYDPTILPQGQVDALAAYKSNEPLTLAAAGHQVTEWDPADYGIESTFNTQVANTAWAEANPTAVEDFLRASFHALAWLQESDENLQQALGWAEARSDAGYEAASATERFATEVALMNGAQPAGLPIGATSAAQFTPEAEMLLEYDLVKTQPDVEAAQDPDYVAAIYDGTELVWPAPQ
ncbi:MAG: ABC transporter substrate-binding protein [Herbiconiux sp.]|nr:ABC transporter substrate-binding protein [Herbiconiux sp.]